MRERGSVGAEVSSQGMLHAATKVLEGMRVMTSVSGRYHPDPPFNSTNYQLPAVVVLLTQLFIAQHNYYDIPKLGFVIRVAQASEVQFNFLSTGIPRLPEPCTPGIYDTRPVKDPYRLGVAPEDQLHKASLMTQGTSG